jgi:hypothetical protein
MLRKLASRERDLRPFAGQPFSIGEHATTVGTDVFRDRPLMSPRLFQASYVDRDLHSVTLLKSAVEQPLKKSLSLCTTVHGSPT